MECANTGHAKKPRLCKIADRLPQADTFYDPIFKPLEVLLAQFKKVIVPVSRCPLGADHAAIASMLIKGHQQRNITFLRRADQIFFIFATFKFRHDGSHTPPAKIERKLITELAIVIGNTGNALHSMAAICAPFVNFLELSAHEATTTKFRQGSNQLWSSHTELDSFIGPRLGDQIQRGDNSSSGCFFDNCKITRLEGCMWARQQVSRPGDHTQAVELILAMNIAVEFAKRVRIL